MAWLTRCFNPCTSDKANGHTRLLVCDGHDSHISAEFVRYCYEHDIALLLLLPHSSHLIQPLDVGVFSPLKAAMRSTLSTIFRTGILRLQKPEWIQSYIKAREKAMTRRNIESGWRGAGLWPINPQRIINQLPEETTTPPPSSYESNDAELLTSSPPDGYTLQLSNASLNAKIAATTLASPIKRHVHRVSKIAEQLCAETAILHREFAEMKAVMDTRKERDSGKRKILKGHRVVTRPDVIEALEEAERSTKERRAKKRRNYSLPGESELSIIEVEHSDKEDAMVVPERPVYDCIIIENM